MSSRRRIIIDTDPGVDDVLAMLLACSDRPEELEIMLISVTHGNVGVLDCLNNVMTLFHVINEERKWRHRNGLPLGFDTLDKYRPLVAVGAKQPLEQQQMLADFFHGRDGLGGSHTSHPEFNPSEAWKQLFGLPQGGSNDNIHEAVPEKYLFTPSTTPAPKEILRLLRENPTDTITLVAIGPLTNFALAAAEDPETFLKAKEVVVMGGAINAVGNARVKTLITPLAEFNTHADAVAAARVFALTSPNPTSTMPPPRPIQVQDPGAISAEDPSKLSRQLNLTLLPLDITTFHNLVEDKFIARTKPLIDKGSPVALWMSAFLPATFDKVTSGESTESRTARAIGMHDPLAVYYAIRPSSIEAGWKIQTEVDVRAETSGQWTRGACITDQRQKAKRSAAADVDITLEVVGDTGGWLSERRGNRLNIVTNSNFTDNHLPEHEKGVFGELLCKAIFGQPVDGFL